MISLADVAPLIVATLILLFAILVLSTLVGGPIILVRYRIPRSSLENQGSGYSIVT